MAQETMDFTTGSIFKKLLKFMLPILGALVLQTMYGAADIIIVGWFGSESSISAVSSGSTLICMVVFVINALAMGVTIYMGRLLGEGNRKRLNQIIGGAIALFLIIAAVMTAVLLVFAPWFASVVNAPVDAFAKTITYIRVCGAGIVFIIGYNLISSIFRGIGNSRLPLIFVLVACIFNVFGDLLFVIVFQMDVAGAALATVLAQALSLVMSIIVCKNKRVELPFELNWKDIRLNREVRHILFLGFPICVQEFLTQFTFLLLLAFVNGMGSTQAIRLASSSGYGVAGKVTAIIMLVLSIIVCKNKRVELPFELNWRDIRLNREVRHILFLGFPICVQEFLTQFTFLLLLAFVNGMGSTQAIRLASSSGYGVAGKVTAIIMLVPSALMQSMSSFIAQNVGAGKEKRAQKAMGFGMLIGGVIGIFMTAVAFFYGQQLAALFTPNVAYQIKAAEYLAGFSLEAIITSVLFSFIGYYNGHNQTMFVLFQGLAQSFLVRLPMAYAMARMFPDNMTYVGAAMPAATLFGIMLNTLYYNYYTKKIGASTQMLAD